ncbi:hypothetical protein BpHYR1_040626 [Brachionus plicatilis]|uniref:Uncharacterized protein n=1 Tax=Brachionus plicatilis TaxID=10195 RepID=A0A3M7RYR8_BRAPC|nr:hypothetical protein BpHYR1_040626 [Brachionus plicatilis]
MELFILSRIYFVFLFERAALKKYKTLPRQSFQFKKSKTIKKIKLNKTNFTFNIFCEKKFRKLLFKCAFPFRKGLQIKTLKPSKHYFEFNLGKLSHDDLHFFGSTKYDFGTQKSIFSEASFDPWQHEFMRFMYLITEN